jgi:signal transduction histidine kinase
MTESQGIQRKGLREARSGLRGETALVLPLATGLVVLLSLATLLAYRSAIAEFRDSERSRVLAASQKHVRLATQATGSRAGDRLSLPAGALAIARLDPDGIATASSAGLEGANLAAGLFGSGARALQAPVARGPGAGFGDVIVAFVPHGSTAGAPAAFVERIDWPAPVVAKHQRRFPILATTVAAADAALVALVLLYRRRRLRPFEGLIERAQAVERHSEDGGEDADEVTHLLRTFDRALAELKIHPPNDQLTDAIRDSIQDSYGDEVATGLLLIDAGGQFLALNDMGARWLEVRADVVGQSYLTVLAHQPELRAIVGEAVQTQQAVRRRECTLHTASGEERVLGLTLSRLSRGDGPLRGWLGLFTDLTAVQRENRESMLSASLAQIAEMSAGLAHELRNGMASLRGYATLLARSDLNPRQKEDLGELQLEVDHLHRVAEDFLSFARPGTARSEVFDLRQVARRAVADPALEEVDIRFESSAEATDPRPASETAPGGPSSFRLRGDPQLIERLLRNLLHNAARSHRDLAAPEPILVRLSSSRSPPSPGDLSSFDGTQVEILDRGAGIPEDLQDRLFTPFARGNEDGVGLGLALARRIADLHHAELSLEARPGGGTLARLRFPGDARA